MSVGKIMRSSYGPETLLLASKKPRIKELVSRVSDLTEDEIRQLAEKPDTIKGLLNIKKGYSNKESLARAELLADMMIKASTPSSPDIFEIYHYIGETTWIKSGATFLEIKEGWHWGKMKDNKILVSSNQIVVQPTVIKNLEYSSKKIKSGSIFDLLELERSRLAKL